MKRFIFICCFSLFAFSCNTTSKSITDNSPRGGSVEKRTFMLTNIYPEMKITILFLEGQVSGFAGINRYFAQYNMDGDIFSVSTIGSTKMAGPTRSMAAETDYLTMLESATSIMLDGDTLTIGTKLSDKKLVYKEIK